MPAALADYVRAKRVGALVTTAGQVSAAAGRENRGKLGATLGVEQGREATRACVINCMAALPTLLDSLDRSDRSSAFTCS